MKKFAALILGSALTALLAGTAFADSTAPAESRDVKPAAGASAPAPVAASALKAAVAAAPATAVAPAAAAPAATAPEPMAPVAAKDQGIKIGYVDMSRVAAETDTGKAAASALKAKSEKLRTKIEAKQKQLEKQKAAIEAKIESLTPKERAAKAKEFQKKMEEYQKLVRASDLEMQEMQEKLTGEVLGAIKKAAAAYGKSHGYAIVLGKKDVLYLSDAIEPRDLTDEIAAQLNHKTESK